MKLIQTSSFALMTFVIAFCSPSKKATKSESPVTPVATAPVENKGSFNIGPGFPSKPADGVYAPGNEELTALQVKYKEVTLETLSAGHQIYTTTCTNCHGPMNIYRYPEATWTSIMERMAPMAKLTEVEKDAVYKYVLSIKATQP